MIKQISPLLLALSVMLLQPIGVIAQEMIRVSPTATTNQQQTMTVKVWAGRATAIDFSAVHQRITSVVLGDPSRLVYTADAPIESGQASTRFLKQIQPLRFPGATTATLTNLLIKTIDAQGKQQLHSFNVMAAHGSPEYSNVQVSRTAAKTNSIAPTLSTPALLERVEAGIQVTIARGLAKAEDPLFDRVRQFLKDVRGGDSMQGAASSAGVSLALLQKLSELGAKK